MHPNFSASNQWISDTLEACRSFELPVLSAVHESDWLLPLLIHFVQHDALKPNSPSEGELEMVLKGDPKCFAHKVSRFFPCYSLDALLNGASLAGCVPGRLRQTEVKLETWNQLTTAFRPPRPSELRRAMTHLMKEARCKVQRATTPSQKVGVALGTYFILLTIHPLKDGNGRTARANFVGAVAELSPISPLLLLGLCLLHQERSSAFHLAASLARMGETGALLEIFHSAVEQANRWLSDDLAVMSGLRVQGSNPSLHQILPLVLELKNKLSVYVNP